MPSPPLDAGRLDALLGAVRDISACRGDTEFRDTVLGAVGGLVEADMHYVFDVNGETGSMEIAQAPLERALPDEVALAAIFSYRHPLVDRFLATGDGSARRLSDVVSRHDYHALPIYVDHYGEHGVEHQIGAVIPCPGTRLFSVGLNRADADFSDEEVATIDRLRPHLVQSATNVEVRTRLASLVEASSDEGVHGAALIDSGRIVEADTRVVASLRAAFGSEASASSLPGDVAGWSQAEATRLDSVDDRAGARLHSPLVARHDRGRVVLRYVKGEESDVVVVDERAADPPTGLRGYGLTTREAEVLGALADGATNKQIGRDLGISPHTVRKHLERIYRKMSVDSRTAAVALAYEVFLSRDGR